MTIPGFRLFGMILDIPEENTRTDDEAQPCLGWNHSHSPWVVWWGPSLKMSRFGKIFGRIVMCLDGILLAFVVINIPPCVRACVRVSVFRNEYHLYPV